MTKEEQQAEALLDWLDKHLKSGGRIIEIDTGWPVTAPEELGPNEQSPIPHEITAETVKQYRDRLKTNLRIEDVLIRDYIGPYARAILRNEDYSNFLCEFFPVWNGFFHTNDQETS